MGSNSLNTALSGIVTTCNSLNSAIGYGITPLVVAPFSNGDQLFADAPNANSLNPVLNQITGFLNQLVAYSQPDITNVANQLGLTPAQLNNNFSNPNNPPNPNNQQKLLPLNPSGATITLAGSLDGTTINLSWNNPYTNATGFNIYRSVNSGSYTLLSTQTGATCSAIVTDGNNYAYKVAAYNLINQSGYSNIVTEETRPAAPTYLIGSGGSSVSLSWTNPSPNNQTGFHIYRNGSIVGSTSNTYYTDSPSPGNYLYKVTAYNQYGESGVSNTVNETVLPPPEEAPSNVSFTYTNPRQTSDNQVNVDNGTFHWQNNGLTANSISITLHNQNGDFTLASNINPTQTSDNRGEFGFTNFNTPAAYKINAIYNNGTLSSDPITITPNGGFTDIVIT
jgi:hypothetical protein